MCRAVRLILAGALDEGNEADLAEHLGLSGRHLRRLFLAHVGATPDQLARAGRAHFARQLLDDTGLSVTEIAFAAGFGSLRQFNRAFQEMFRTAPSEVRGRRPASGWLSSGTGLQLRLPYQGPLDWDALTYCLAAHAVPGVEEVSPTCYRRTVNINGDAGTIELRPGDSGYLILVACLPHWQGLMHIAARARRIAGLDEDLSEPTRHLGADPLVGPLLAARPGLRVPGAWSPYETAIAAVISQQQPAEVTEIMTRLVQQFGTPVPRLDQPGLTHTFPPPGLLAAASVGQLINAGLSVPAARAVCSLVHAVTRGQLRLDRSICLDELIASLTALDGIGDSCAHYIALRLGEPDAYPSAGLSPQTAIPSEQIAQQWRPWRALAASHLWASRAGQWSLAAGAGGAALLTQSW